MIELWFLCVILVGLLGYLMLIVYNNIKLTPILAFIISGLLLCSIILNIVIIKNESVNINDCKLFYYTFFNYFQDNSTKFDFLNKCDFSQEEIQYLQESGMNAIKVTQIDKPNYNFGSNIILKD